MKRISLLLCFITLSSQAQIVNFPDPIFKSEILSITAASQAAKNLDGDYIKIDANNDGEIQVTEALNVSYLELPSNENVTGVEAFVNLVELDASFNLFYDIDLTQMTNLEILDVSNGTNFTEIDLTQNINLKHLNISENGGLSVNMDISQNLNLEYLDCEWANIFNLDLTQHSNLTYLNCSWNWLESLDVSQNQSLEYLDVSYNDPYYNGFDILDLSNNYNLQYVNATMQSLYSLNIKNGTQEQLEFGFYAINEFICADLEDFPMLEAIGSGQSSIQITTYCDFEPGGNFNTIEGTVLYDFNANGCDAGDIALEHVIINSTDGTNGGLAFANNYGDFVLYSEAGNFTLTPSIENPSFFNFSPPSANVSFPDNNNNSATQDFCITPSGTHSDVEITISPIGWPEPGYDLGCQLVFRNKGNQLESGTVNFNFQEDILDVIYTSLNPDIITSGSLTWNYDNFEPFESRAINIILNLNSPMETPAVNIDDLIDFSASITPVAGDELPNDNSATLQQVVVGSFDPNNMICTEGDIVSPDMIGEYLHYTINFENTGTAAANFVVVTSEIDESLYDLNSLQIMHSSHNMNTILTNNKLEFIFDAINLIPEGTGNVVFKIKSKDDLSIGDSVESKANIYFDYNFPIETNIATTTFDVLSIEEFEFDNSVSVYPNPTNGLLYLKSNTSIEALELFDIQGRKVQDYNISEANMLDVSSLSKGVYFIEIATTNGKTTKKIIKD